MRLFYYILQYIMFFIKKQPFFEKRMFTFSTKQLTEEKKEGILILKKRKVKTMIYVLMTALLALAAFFVYIFVSTLKVNAYVRKIIACRRHSSVMEAQLDTSQMKLAKALRYVQYGCKTTERLFVDCPGELARVALKSADNQIQFYLSRNPQLMKNEVVYQHMVTYKRDLAMFNRNKAKEEKMREKIKAYSQNPLLGNYADAADQGLQIKEETGKKLLGFGLMRLPMLADGGVDTEQSAAMADCMLQHGFTYFDTAYFYLDGRSEIVAREILTERHPRGSFRLADKMPINHLKAEEDVARIFDEQLTKTGAGYFDFYLLHALNNNSYEKTAKKFGVFEFVAQKKQEGKVRRMGFSFHDSPEVLEKILCEHPEVDFVQLQLNYYDWESKDVQSRRLYEIAREHGKEIVVMEPIKGGMLASLPPNVKDMLSDLLEKDSPATLALRFIAAKEGIMMVLSGMSTLEQAMENAACMSKLQPLSEEECQRLLEAAEVIRSIPTFPCTNCRYCQEACPKRIPIPTVIRNVNRRLRGADVVIKDAENCIGCGACEARCPQKIAIRKIMSDLTEESV